jgi:predicted transglutaminase-like cysteine proteinase
MALRHRTGKTKQEEYTQDMPPSDQTLPLPARRPALQCLRTLLPALAVLYCTAASSPSVMAAYEAGGKTQSLFSSREVKSGKLHLFPKWQGALSRHFNEAKLSDAPCTETAFNRCHLRRWQTFLSGLEEIDRMSQVKAVNHFFNRHRYIIDPKNYGVLDYWASPFQFMTRDGDCEDYAITKYFSLRSLGFSAESMRIVVLQDLNLQTAHAVLAVYMGKKIFVLDNQIPTVVEASAILHYRPIYSINEKHWWLHRL